MNIDVLIVGQGVCGTFLSRELERAGLSYLVIDEARPFTASKAAAGLINPVTGRRIVKTWMIDQLLSFACSAYEEAGSALGISCLTPTSIVDFFPGPQMRNAFFERYTEDPEYLQVPPDEAAWRGQFQYEFGFGAISPCYLVDLQGLLSATRSWLLGQQRLREEKFEETELFLENDGVRYRDIRAKRIIFCDGMESFKGRWFTLLPFAPNKGEVLIVEIPDLAPSAVFKKGISLIPLADGRYWVGSSYDWAFNDSAPTEAFRHKTEAILKNWLKVPFQTVDHFASIRPATLERRPFVGFHPLYPAIGILNGMGTKGCSLAPYFARQLADHMVEGAAILPEADVRRFSRILSR